MIQAFHAEKQYLQFTVTLTTQGASLDVINQKHVLE